MITLHLTGQSEKLAPDNPWRLSPPPLYHQVRTADALCRPDLHLVMNSYNTGTGKTRAALLHLFNIGAPAQNVLLVAPTNALLGQHAEDARRFVAQYELDYKVIEVNAALLATFREGLIAQADYTDRQLRKGETLFRLVRNYRDFYPDETRRRGLLFVVNPDIFYYALMFRYGAHDQRNLFQSFLTHFDYIIIDEFHYYDQKQLAFFLFFFAISHQMGYFDRAGRKICLLSATPNANVLDYLDRLFGPSWLHISPDNEPAESAGLDVTPTLAPLTLTIEDQRLPDWGRANAPRLQVWLDDGLDGAIISDSLRHINRLFADLLPRLSPARLGRITGPEPQASRLAATARSLILATPTVDIGYNFEKETKPRQNVDFLVCEARYGDDLIQRIGRAGRVLGKPQTDQPATAVALLAEAAVATLRPYDGQTLTRAQFRAVVEQHQDVLPHKHDLTGYIRTWAITEVFYPLYRAHDLLVMPEERQLIEALFEQLHDVFGVRRGANVTFHSLNNYFRKFYYRQKWLKVAEKGIPFNRDTAYQVADWLRFRGEAEYDPADIEPWLGDAAVLGHPALQVELRAFVQSQVHLTESLFHFRNSFQGPTAVVYDPQRLLSSAEINAHDLFHIVEAYEVHWYEQRADFVAQCGDTELTGVFYGHLQCHRDPLLSLELRYRTDDDQQRFDDLWSCRPVALVGFGLDARQRGGDYYPLDWRISRALSEQFLTVLLIPPDLRGWAIHRMRQSPLYARKVTIDFRDYQGVEYSAYLGQAAWLAHPELLQARRLRDSKQCEAIIL